MRILEGLTERHPAIAWEVMVSMLPEGHAVGMQSHKPEFRSWAEGVREVGRDEYRALVTEVSNRLADAAASDAARLDALVSKFDRLIRTPKAR